jgi:hypothetical protein
VLARVHEGERHRERVEGEQRADELPPGHRCEEQHREQRQGRVQRGDRGDVVRPGLPALEERLEVDERDVRRDRVD